MQNSLKDRDIRLDDGLIEVLDPSVLALVSIRVSEVLSHNRLLVF